MPGSQAKRGCLLLGTYPAPAQHPVPTAPYHSALTESAWLCQHSPSGPKFRRLPWGLVTVRGQLTVTDLPTGLAFCPLVPALPTPH